MRLGQYRKYLARQANRRDRYGRVRPSSSPASNTGALPNTPLIPGQVGLTGPEGAGWTGGSYDSSTGAITFTSYDGLEFSTSDIRGSTLLEFQGDDGGTAQARTDNSIDVIGANGITTVNGAFPNTIIISGADATATSPGVATYDANYFTVTNGEVALATDIDIVGNLSVGGTTTTINSTTLQVDDKNIELGTVTSPTDATAALGGITLKGTIDKTIQWLSDTWYLSENVSIPTGKEYKINGVSVISNDTLGASVVNSSLTSVGTISTGVWEGDPVSVYYGGTGWLNPQPQNGQLLIGNGGSSFSLTTLNGLGSISISNGAGSISILGTDTNTQLSQEQVEDYAGALIANSTGTHTGVTVTYQDTTGDIDFVVDDTTKLPLVGGTLSGNIDLGNNNISNISSLTAATLTASSLSYPSSDGVDGDCIITDGTGNLSWGNPERVYIQVRNDEGATIAAGSPLYSKGEIGGSSRINVGVCDADDSAKMPCIGLAVAEMNTSSTKDNYGIVSGVYNVNLSGFSGLSVNDNLYVTTTGGLSQTRPTGGSDLIQNVGIVLKTNGTTCQGLLVSAIGRTNDVPNSIADTYIASASTWSGKQDALTFGISNTNTVKIESVSVAEDDYAVFTANGLQGLDATEVKTDLSLNNVDNTSDVNKPISSATQTALDNTQKGWHGHTDRVKLLVTDFLPSDASSTYNLGVYDFSLALNSLKGMSTSLDFYGYKEIPSGYKATSLTLYVYHKFASDSTAITVYEGFIDSSTAVSKGTGNATGSLASFTFTLDFTDFNSTDTNQIMIHIDPASTFRLYGGYISIAEI